MALDNNVPSVAFTYAEPAIWFEYILDCAILLKKNNIKVVLVSNGMINREPLLELRNYIDAINIDIKGMSHVFYRKMCHGLLDPVLDTCRLVSETCHLEITNLLITNENDSIQEIHNLASFISGELGSDTPLHLSRYYPAYKLLNPPTPVQTVIRSGEIASKYLKNVYLGNLPINVDNNTYCKCGHLLIKRDKYRVSITKQNKSGLCPKCNAPTGIIFS